MREKKAFRLWKILISIEKNTFSATEFSRKEEVSLKTVRRDIKLLREKKLILGEGETSAVKYKITEKYKKLKKKP